MDEGIMFHCIYYVQCSCVSIEKAETSELYVGFKENLHKRNVHEPDLNKLEFTAHLETTCVLFNLNLHERTKQVYIHFEPPQTIRKDEWGIQASLP